MFLGVNVVDSLSSEKCECDSKCVNFKHNLGIDILSVEINITQEWMLQYLIYGKSAMVQIKAQQGVITQQAIT